MLKINTAHGPVEGFVDKGLRKWFGIPFAKPPVGSLRFKRSESPEPWIETRQCTKMSAAPYQFTSGNMAAIIKSDSPQSEDCLYLNVWAPMQANKQPVFVWIYGGAHHGGEASTVDFDLSSFAKNGVIGVSFNYRLGPLGFYDFSKLDSSFDSNCAVSDMILALQWVHNNIENFGGDPENVTICGESAGGTGVYSLLSAPTARGYFQKAIAMSGVAPNVTSYRTHELNNKLFFESLGLNPENVAELRTLSPEELQKGGRGAFAKISKVYPGGMFSGPVIDDLIPQYPWDALANGLSKDIKCIFGSCRDEGNAFYGNGTNVIPETWEQIKTCYELNDMPELLEPTKRIYAGMKEKDAVCAWARDRMFWAGAVKCALAQSKHNSVYTFRFDFCSAISKLTGMGAHHALDIGPALNTYTGPMNIFHKLTSKHRAEHIRQVVHGSFLQFVKTGDPNGVIPVTWPVFDSESRACMLFADNCFVVFDPNREVYEFWKDIMLYQ